MAIEMRTLSVGGLSIDLVRKSIKNLHLAVYPPDGRIRVAAPWHVSEDAIRLAVAKRVAWINRQRRNFKAQERQAKRRYVSGETHYFLGRGYRLQVISNGATFRVRLGGANRIELAVPIDADRDAREQVMLRWHRRELRKRAEAEAAKWAARLGIDPPVVGIKQMRTKWGTSNPSARRIWLNLELAQKPPRCIAYIVLHELVHFEHRKHGDEFVAKLERFMPNWRAIRDELNKLPLATQPWCKVKA
ncbi:M48 family metallopeptidase [Novosphingobium sp. KN65.2]|uniref:M48 family metallopeptidase n=1 Tax=Novosphingobium sp. KN65.2 TaxID=1478134 RepID=UPI0006D5B111|nr:SprT family zinc-dependent metalloprotease [Novosphingobium sp. KN65.2]